MEVAGWLENICSYIFEAAYSEIQGKNKNIKIIRGK